MAQDKTYQHYARANAVYERHLQARFDEFRRLDVSIGAERMNRGSSFEERAAWAVRDLVADAVCRRNAAVRRNALQWFASAEWIDPEGRHLGEIDFVAVCDKQLVALVELKAHCFELVTGYHQQLLKCVQPNRSN